MAEPAQPPPLVTLRLERHDLPVLLALVEEHLVEGNQQRARLRTILRVAIEDAERL